MNKYQWRSRARVVAYLDLVFTILYIIVTVCIIIGAASLTFASYEKDTDRNEENVRNRDMFLQLVRVYIIPLTEVDAWILWLVAIVNVILITLSIWVLGRLFKATQQETESRVALTGARIWIILNSVLLVYSFAVCIYSLSLNWFWCMPLIEILFMHVILNYVREIENDIGSFSSKLGV